MQVNISCSESDNDVYNEADVDYHTEILQNSAPQLLRVKRNLYRNLKAVVGRKKHNEKVPLRFVRGIQR